MPPSKANRSGPFTPTTGDGLLVEFASVVDAVRCAVEVQRAMIDRNAKIAEDRRIIFRIGINLGDVIIDGDDIYGDGVNIAARLESLAEPSGICISRVALRQTRRGNFVITAGQTPLLEPISPDDEATGLINHALR